MREKVRFFTERTSIGVQACVILMALAAAFRFIGCWGMWIDRSYAITQIALPIVSALLIILFVYVFGKKLLWLTFIPVTLGAVFFIIKALSFESILHTVLCILLYIAVIALYFCTVFGIFRTKWLLVPLFGLPFLYHVFVEDLPALSDTVHPVSFASGMQEMSVLCIMLGLLFLSLAMKKEILTVEHGEELPKIRPPKVILQSEKPSEEPAPREQEENLEKPLEEAPEEEVREEE